jgi:hypothetical protein
MSDDGSDDYRWRETYFIMFSLDRRPTLTQVERVLGEVGRHVQFDNLTADEDGHFESLILQSPDDYAALEISFEAGEAVIEQAVDLAKQLQSDADPEQLAQLLKSDARLDVMHFERVVQDEANDEEEEMLDPSCLLLTVDLLREMTEGIAIDPASGAILP